MVSVGVTVFIIAHVTTNTSRYEVHTVRPETPRSQVPRTEGPKVLKGLGGTPGRKQCQGLITLFTTLRSTPRKMQLHKNMMQNWAMLGPHVVPLLFADKGMRDV